MAGALRGERKATGYPTRQDIDPKVVRDSLPRGWRTLLKIGGAAGVFVAGTLAGCRSESGTPASPPPRADGATTQPGGSADRGSRVLPAAAIVAPIFKHGEGRATAGCVVIAPPVFLTEEEALQVVKDELAKSGLKFTESKVELADVQIKQTMGDTFGEKEVESVGPAQPLKMDLRDAKHAVAVEFVGQDDYFKLGGPMSGSTVQSYRFKDVAEKLTGQLSRSRKEKTYFGVFYDPGVRLERGEGAEDWRAAVAKRKDASKSELRQQVRDFAEWLKQHGAI